MESSSEQILAAIGFAADLSMHARTLEEILPEVLERLAKAAAASRSYVYRNITADTGELLMDEMTEWCAPGIAPGMDDPRNRMVSYMPGYAHYVKALGVGGPIVLHAASARGIDLEDLTAEGIISSVFVPIFLREEWWGYLGFDDCLTDREWSDDEVHALEAAAGIIGATVERLEIRSGRGSAAPDFRTIVEKIPAVTYIDVVTDPDIYPYDTVYMSPQIEDITGYPPEPFVEDPAFWDTLIHPDDLEDVAQLDLDPASSKRFESEYRLIARDGHVVWIHDEAERVSYTPGQQEIWHGVMYDITPLKEDAERQRLAAEKLRAVDAMKDTFLDAVSHELRTPVAAIMGMAMTLERSDLTLSEEDRREFLAGISRNAQKLQHLITDLLDINRLKRGALGIEVELRRVDDIAASVFRHTDLPASHQVSFTSEPATALVDQAKVERIVENLIMNATRHTPAGTAITLSVTPHEGGALIRVDDAGPGVRPDLRGAIFEPFRQAERPTQGAGIGLSLVSSFADMHGGRAWVEERDGGGASFRVFLPGSHPDAGS